MDSSAPYTENNLTNALVEALSMIPKMQENMIRNQYPINGKRTEIEILRQQNAALRDMVDRLEKILGGKI
jgi:hypothetical protein